ncbi:19752_t:CDS:2 [Racocetra persica]|uniref:19752_t:CDS:1 n=1 Tax=Racocetra persica TaxID=160502 RepID=A0ACA9KF42_9GLOM|nr:19752_t:CDS:2 [Racocetra persica]
MTVSSSIFKWKHLIVLIIFIAFVTICSGSGHVIKKRQAATGKSPQAPSPQPQAPQPQAPAPQVPQAPSKAPQVPQAPQEPPAQSQAPPAQSQAQPAQTQPAPPSQQTQPAQPQPPAQQSQPAQPAQQTQPSPQGQTQPGQPAQTQPGPQGQGQTQPAPQPVQTQAQGGTHQSASGNDQKSTSLSFVVNDFTINSCTDTLKCSKENIGTTDKHVPSTTAPKVTSELTTTYDVCTNNPNCKVVPLTPGQSAKMVTTTQPADTKVITLAPANGASPKPNAKYTTTKFTSTMYQVYPGYSIITSSTGSDGQVATYETYVPPSTVVVLKEVTGVQEADALSTDGIVGGGNSFNEMRRSGSGLLGIIMSLWVVAITLFYMIKNVD